MIDADLEARLYAYIGGIARANKMKLLAIGGITDHIHLLLSLTKTLDIAHAIQLIKGGSSKWIHDEFPERRAFEWQEGYAAFSIGIGEVDRTVAYINRQKEHHAKTDFETEYREFLERHNIEFDEGFLLG